MFAPWLIITQIGAQQNKNKKPSKHDSRVKLSAGRRIGLEFNPYESSGQDAGSHPELGKLGRAITTNQAYPGIQQTGG